MGNTLIGVAACISALLGGVAACLSALNRRNINATKAKVDTVQDTVNGSTLVKERRIEQLTDALTTAGEPVPMHQPADPPHEPGTGTRHG